LACILKGGLSVHSTRQTAL